MSFDRIAPFYRSIEAIAAGNQLQECRLAHLSRVDAARNILILGEGNGRFLTECRRSLPKGQITCIDSSSKMLELARRRVKNSGQDPGSIQFIHANALEWHPAGPIYDLIVTHFFLDCFPIKPLETLIRKLSEAATPQAEWLVTDFAMPQSGLRRLRARIIHGLLYCFFGIVSNLPARTLTPPDAFLNAHGFHLQDRITRSWGLLHSDLWKRGTGGP